MRFELDATWTVFDSEARNLTLQYSRVSWHDLAVVFRWLRDRQGIWS